MTLNRRSPRSRLFVALTSISSLAALTVFLSSPIILAQSIRNNEQRAASLSSSPSAYAAPAGQQGSKAVIAAAASSSSSQSGLSFATAVTYGFNEIVSWVAVADVNGDGIPDLLVASTQVSSPGPGVAVFLGNGNGTFKAPVIYGSGVAGAGVNYVAVRDLNGDGKPDLVIAYDHLFPTRQTMVGVLLGNGDGTFQTAITYPSSLPTPGPEDGLSSFSVSIAIGDVNGDGKPDLVVGNITTFNGAGETGGYTPVDVLLGNGDGTFQAPVEYDLALSFGVSPLVTLTDVNGDGHPDMEVAENCGICGATFGTVGVLLNNGDGTFQNDVPYNSGGFPAVQVAVADVNGDGKPDLLVANGFSNGFDGVLGTVGVLFGNGDGTFQAPASWSTNAASTDSITLADMNGDGKLDVVVANGCTSTSCPGGVSILLGNGDGTYQPALTYSSGGVQSVSVAVSDLNRDGRPDIVVANQGNNTVGVLINTSLSATTTSLISTLNPSDLGQSVTFTATVHALPGFSKGTPTGTVTFFNGTSTLGSSPLNSEGVAKLTISTLAVGPHSITASYKGGANFASSTSSAISQVVKGAIVQLSPTTFNFGDQTVGTASAGRTLTLTNTGSLALSISSFEITGSNPGSFGKSSSCGTSLAAGSSCKTTLTFHPTAAGTRTAAVTISDNASGSPQTVPLTGVGVVPAVTLSPASLTFPTQLIFSTSAAKTVKLTNSGQGVLKISQIDVTAPFSQTNNCGSTVNTADSCTITVKFSPTKVGALSGTISISDNASGSPEKISLSGTATAIQLSPALLNFGTQPKGTTSLSKTITLSNKSDATVSSLSISIAGTDPGDFKQTTTCGTSIASGASCFIQVKFTPAATGARSATVSISDNGGGSPQKVSLTGTGT